MSEDKKAPRSTQEIQQEYQNLAFRAGNLQYELSQKGKDLTLINDQMRNLNFEFISSKEAEDAAAKLASDTPPNPETTPTTETLVTS